MSMIKKIKLLAALTTILLLQACSGGSGGGASERAPVVTNTDLTGFTYEGPVPANSDIQHFKTTFYDNAVIRCGSCHTTGGVGTTAFTDTDNVNVAYEQAQRLANLNDPGASELVRRLESGHNCWLNSNASCASAMTGYIERWAQGATQSQSSVALSPRVPQPLAGLKILPATFAEANSQLNVDITAEPELVFLLRTYCAGCHAGSASTPQSPFFASDNDATAYTAMAGKIDLATPANSRFVVRLRNSHNCWSNSCDSDAQVIQNAIGRLSDDLPEVSVDSNLVISAAQILDSDGIIASGGGRFETDVIAKWEFREGEGDQVADTSGVQPETPMTVVGQFDWVGGWGVRLDGGRVQAAVSGSAKIHERLATAGEYSIEAWVAPNNVTQEDAWIIGYAGGPQDRNVLLTQTLYNYDFYNRSSANAESNGGPATSTADADEIAQATLQHLVLTYDPVNGRKIFVNGEDAGVVDEQGPGNLSNWSSEFALVMGSDFAGSSKWSGVIRMVALHSKALTQQQIMQNYDVGVGEKFFLMFSVADLLPNEPACKATDAGGNQTDYCYIVFEVSQFDSFSYVFSAPRFANINPEQPDADIDFDLKGIYLGMNGQLVRNGQGFVNVNTAVSGNSFTIEDDPLLEGGSIVPLENGPENDVFFLAFEEIDGAVDQTVEPAPGAFGFLFADLEIVTIGLRTFDEVNLNYSSLTGVPIDSAAVSNITGKTVSQTYASVRRSLASVADFQTYMASHQMAVTQLAGAYCDAVVEDSSLRAQLFTDGSNPFNFSAPVASVADSTWSDQVIYPLVDKVFGTGLDKSQPNSAANRTAVHDELLTLITDPRDDSSNERVPDGKQDGLKFCNGSCPAGRTAEVVKAVCTTVMASAPALIK